MNWLDTESPHLHKNQQDIVIITNWESDLSFQIGVIKLKIWNIPQIQIMILSKMKVNDY